MKFGCCKIFISQDFLKIKNFKMVSMKIFSLTTLINELTITRKMHWIKHFIFSSSCFYLMVQLPTFDVNGKGLPLLSKVFWIMILFYWDSVLSFDHNWGKILNFKPVKNQVSKLVYSIYKSSGKSSEEVSGKYTFLRKLLTH